MRGHFSVTHFQRNKELLVSFYLGQDRACVVLALAHENSIIPLRKKPRNKALAI